MKKKMKKQKRNGPHVNKYDPDGNKAKKAMADLDHEDKKGEQQQVSPEPTTFSRADPSFSTEGTYSCSPYFERKTVQQAKACPQYSPPNNCRSSYSHRNLCTVMASGNRF